MAATPPEIVAVPSVTPPDVNVIVPVAPAGTDCVSLTFVPYGAVGGRTITEDSGGVAWVIVSDDAVDVLPLYEESPEYTAVTVYVPTLRLLVLKTAAAAASISRTRRQ